MRKQQKDCIAMLLAGGQGSRLYMLTSRVAKPAVSFGGKYRIIDFPLSNCTNSQITTVGVLTMYQPLTLNEYIGNGQPWDLDRNYGGVHILSPYTDRSDAGWYKGTANAIYQNMAFMKRYRPKYVLILSGDHIYKMDYRSMLNEHIKNNADCTIAVMRVPIEEASRFGIMEADQDGRITAFEEKPAQPKSNLASMGIYIFTSDVLFDELEKDEQDPHSVNDFGRNIIPKMLAQGSRMFVYNFEGYWKDVGTLQSLWEANMDLLTEKPKIDIFAPQWKIYSRTESYPPQLIMENAHITQSIITEGTVVYGSVDHSVISSNVVIGEGALVNDSVIMSNVKIGAGAKIINAIIDENTVVDDQVTIGGAEALTVVGRDNHIKADVAPGAMVEEGKQWQH